MPRAGDVVADKYCVEGLLAVGGMASILTAKHIGLGERVALKMLLPRYSKSPEFVRRFRREARATARLKSEHVARVLDFGSCNDGTPFLAMELLEGEDLDAVLQERGPLSQHEAVDLVLQACEALIEAHAHGIVHRDLKPQNFFMAKAPDGGTILKVIDFGIAKSLKSKGGLTRKQSAMGTPCYMSPEQFRASESVDARSDIWALGIILYELLTCKAVFDAPTVAELLVRIEHLDPVLELGPKHAPALADVILRCLRPNRDERFASVRELAEALVPLGAESAAARVEKLCRVESSACVRACGIDDEEIDVGPLESTGTADRPSSVPTLAAAVETKNGTRFSLLGKVAVVSIVVVAGSFLAGARAKGEAVAAGRPPVAVVEPPAKAIPLVENTVEERQVIPVSISVRTAASSPARRLPLMDRDRLFKTRK
jgi:serine/threonine protein kinase